MLLVVTPKPPAALALLPPLYLQLPRSNSPWDLGIDRDPGKRQYAHTPHTSVSFTPSLWPHSCPPSTHISLNLSLMGAHMVPALITAHGGMNLPHPLPQTHLRPGCVKPQQPAETVMDRLRWTCPPLNSTENVHSWPDVFPAPRTSHREKGAELLVSKTHTSSRQDQAKASRI